MDESFKSAASSASGSAPERLRARWIRVLAFSRPGTAWVVLGVCLYAAFMLADLMAGIRRFGGDEVGVEIYDGTEISPETLLYNDDDEPVLHAIPPFRQTPFNLARTMEVEHRSWTLHFNARPVFAEATFGSSLPGFIAAGGVCIGALVFGIARSLLTSQQRAVALATQMTEKLRLQERAMTSSYNGIFILEAARDDYPMIYVNPAFAKMYGSAPNELVGRTAGFLVRRDTDQTDRPRVLAALKAGRECRAVLREYRKDGTRFWSEVSLSPVRDERGRVTHFVGVAEDITERQRAEQALRESQERFALAVQGTNDGLWDWNVLTNEVYFSPRWKSMLGYAEDEIENNFSAWEKLLHPEDRLQSLATVQAYVEGKTQTFELEHRLRHKDGSYRWILARGVAIRDAAGKPVRMAGSHVDLTGRKRAEEELRQAYRELTRSQAALQRILEQLQASHQELEATQLQLIQAAKSESIVTLAAGVAHEVKNPLQTILMGVAYLENNTPKDNENVALALNDMRDAVKRANSIIRELLHFSAASDFELREDDLNQVVERSLWLINNELVASQITAVPELGSGLPRARFDPAKLEQVLINLFINAIQAMSPGGTLTVRTRGGHLGADLQLPARLARHFPPGAALLVAEVQDTGHGIPEKQLAKIYDPFFTTKPVGVGTGLGLAVVKRIVDLHGGAIDVANAAPGGVLVTLVLKA
jgi:PAS domain S-box-containing protein